MRTPRAPVPPGWPGDDPTVPEDLAVLGHRRRGRHRRAPDRPAPENGTDSGADDAEIVAAGAPLAGRAGARDEPDVLPARARSRGDDDLGETGDGGDVEARGAGQEAGAPPTDEHDDLVAGRQPAGRVLVVMVAALVLAMLVNADALVARAERQAPGRGRDRALAIWHPVQDVSHVLQLHRVRQLADRLAGDDGDDAGDDEPVPSTDDTRRRPADDGARETTATSMPADEPPPAAAGPEVRSPTADEPLRLWVGGDSMAQIFGPALAEAAEATGVVSPTVHYEMASGLTRPDYYDWPAALRTDVAADDPEVVVLVVGVNDGQGIVLPDGTPVPEVSDPRWPGEYRRRVAAVMDQLRGDDRLVLWVLLPPMQDPGYGARIAVIREAVVAEAASRPWIVTVDATASVADAAGAYADAVTDPTGAAVELRQSDGIHLASAGADRLATQVLDVVRARVDLSGSSG